MKRLGIAALALMAVFVAAGSALAATKASVIFDSTSPNGPPSNLPSYGPEAYSFKTIGDKITFGGAARTLNSATVTLSSWACQQGTWQNQSCATTPGATFSQPITLTIWNEDHTTQLASSTQTFAVPYRPSASPKCLASDPARPGGWYQSSTKTCKNGLADDVTFNFSHVTLPNSVQYEISYNTNNHGPNPTGVASPADSLNVAITDASTVGSTDQNMWIDGVQNADFGNYTPVVQFKAGNGS